MNGNLKRLRSTLSIALLTMGLVLLLGCVRPMPGSSPLGLLSPPRSPAGTPSADSVYFKLDTPLIAGMTRVSGQGPRGVLLRVVDITAGGEIIGSGVVGNDNRFEIELTAPLKAGREIGIELATAREPETWPALWELRGENAKAIPQLGYFFDTAVTEPTGTQSP